MHINDELNVNIPSGEVVPCKRPLKCHGCNHPMTMHEQGGHCLRCGLMRSFPRAHEWSIPDISGWSNCMLCNAKRRHALDGRRPPQPKDMHGTVKFIGGEGVNVRVTDDRGISVEIMSDVAELEEKLKLVEEDRATLEITLQEIGDHFEFDWGADAELLPWIRERERDALDVLRKVRGHNRDLRTRVRKLEKELADNEWRIPAGTDHWDNLKFFIVCFFTVLMAFASLVLIAANLYTLITR